MIGFRTHNKPFKSIIPHKSMQYNPGDVVEIKTDTLTHTGIMLKRPDLLDENIVVLKLETGYNIGIDKKHIKEIKVKQAYQKPVVTHEKVEHNPKLPTVALLSFGGTISSRVDYKTGGVVADYGADDFYQMLPELKNIANIKTKHVMNIMSEDMNHTHWQKIVDEVTPFLNDPSIGGVVVTQGTDTLHYSVAATSFLFGQLNKPVIFTAAQRSIDRGSTDAFMNLLCAVQAAVKFDGAVVATCMHATINDDYCSLIRGTKVRKMHTSRRDAFRPINEQALAKVFPNGEMIITNTIYPKRSNITVAPKNVFEPKIGILNIYPGMDPSIIQYYVDNKCKGLIIAATALGHVPANTLDALRSASKNMILCVATQTIYGRVHPNVYSRLREMSIDIGMIYLDDMLVETAYTKLGWALAQTTHAEDIERLMTQNIAGEISAEINPMGFLQ
jgi:glutamyl-tRNA(Gln) amidotransferase subunit D